MVAGNATGVGTRIFDRVGAMATPPAPSIQKFGTGVDTNNGTIIGEKYTFNLGETVWYLARWENVTFDHNWYGQFVWYKDGVEQGRTNSVLFPAGSWLWYAGWSWWQVPSAGNWMVSIDNITDGINYVGKSCTVVAPVTVKILSLTPSKTTLNPGEAYTLQMGYEVSQGTYYVYHNNIQIGTFSSGGESGYKTFNLTAPSSPGSYQFTVKLQRAYTGESDSKTYGIEVTQPPPPTVKIINLVPSKTTLSQGEQYTVRMDYQVDAGTYYVKLNNLQIDSFSTGGESGSKTYTLAAPNEPGNYTNTFKLERAYTGESDSKSYNFTVVGPTKVIFTIKWKNIGTQTTDFILSGEYRYSSDGWFGIETPLTSAEPNVEKTTSIEVPIQSDKPIMPLSPNARVKIYDSNFKQLAYWEGDIPP